MAVAAQAITFGAGSYTTIGDTAELVVGGGVVSASGQALALNGANGTINIGANDSLVSSGTSILNWAGTGQVTFAGNVDAQNGLDVTTAALTTAAGFTQSGGSFTFTGVNLDFDPTGTVAFDMDASQTWTVTGADNLANSILFQIGSDAYLDITSTDSLEHMEFGNAVTNPSFDFLGTGDLGVAGGVNVGGSLDVTGNAQIDGNLTVSGLTTFIQSENTSVADRYPLYATGRSSGTPVTTGHVHVVDIDAASQELVAAPGFVADGGTGATVEVADGSVFSVGDIIEIVGSTSNDGIYIIDSISTDELTITQSNTDSWYGVDFVTEAAAGTVQVVSLSISRFGTDGILEGTTVLVTADGASFSDYTAGGGNSLDQAYTQGNTITIDATGPVQILDDGTTSGNKFEITHGVAADTGYAAAVSYDAVAYTGTPHGFCVDLSGATSITNGGNVYGFAAMGITNSGAGESFGIEIDGNWDVGIDNNSALVQNGSAFFSGGLENTANELLVSGGALKVGDDITFFLGDSDDAQIVYNTAGDGTLEVITTSQSGVNGPDIYIAGATPAGGNADGGNITIEGGQGVGSGQNATVTVGVAGQANVIHSDGVSEFQAVVVAQNGLDVTGGTIDLDPAGPYTLDMDSGQSITYTISDNQASAYTVTEAGNNYLDVTTTNASETIVFGNVTTNPNYTFTGSGVADFDGGITLASGQAITGDGTYTLEAQGGGDIIVLAAGEITFDDGNRSGSTVGAAIKFSDTTAEWDAYEAAFGEVSILAAITSAQDCSAVTAVAGVADVGLSLGQLVVFDDAGTNGNIALADHNNSGVLSNSAGLVKAAASSAAVAHVVVAGEVTVADALWDSAPTAANIGAIVYGSVATSGDLTLTAPTASGEVRQKIGLVSFADGSANTTRVSVQVGEKTVIA